MGRDLDHQEQSPEFRFAHVALPDDAIDCDVWRWHGNDDWRRHFETREWNIRGIWVSVAGEQDHHGNIRRWMLIGGEDQCTTSDRTELIAAITEAGQLLDSLSQSVAFRDPDF